MTLRVRTFVAASTLSLALFCAPAFAETKMTGSGITFPDGSKLTSANGLPGGTPSGTSIVSAINDPATSGRILAERLPMTLALRDALNTWTALNTFSGGIAMGGARITGVGLPLAADDAVTRGWVESSAVLFAPPVTQAMTGTENGTGTMISVRSTYPFGAMTNQGRFSVYENGSFVAVGSGNGTPAPLTSSGVRMMWHSGKAAFFAGQADSLTGVEDSLGYFSWVGGVTSMAPGNAAFAMGENARAYGTLSFAFGSSARAYGTAGLAIGSGTEVCESYGIALGVNAKSGSPMDGATCASSSSLKYGTGAVAIGTAVTADRDYSFAMGRYASSNGYQGTFIWSDSTGAVNNVFTSTADNQAAFRASGGIRLRTSSDGSTGCNLSAGSGTWNCSSSRATKENIIPVDGRALLERIRTLPLSTWNYIREGEATRHIGPMAEDFHAAFNLGGPQDSIGVQDLSGVTLAAVQALAEQNAELEARTAEVGALRGEVVELKERLAALEAMVRSQRTPSK